MLNTIIEEIKNGDFPDTIEKLTAYLQKINSFYNSAPNICSILVALVFDKMDNDSEKWLEWAKKEFTCEKSRVYQMKSVGVMLLQIKESCNETFLNLIDVAFGKLHALTGLEGDVLEFLAKYNIHELTRDEVRDKVDCENDGRRKPGKKGKGAKGGIDPSSAMWQPDLFDVMTHVASWDESITEKAALDNRLDAWTSARSGLSLLDVAIRKVEQGEELSDEYYDALVETLKEDIRQLESTRNQGGHHGITTD